MSGCGNGSCSCGSNCSCGSGCQCGKRSGGCKTYPGLSEEKSTATQTVIMGLAPPAHAKGEFEEGASAGSENGGCKCGSNCTCDPCNCK